MTVFFGCRPVKGLGGLLALALQCSSLFMARRKATPLRDEDTLIGMSLEMMTARAFRTAGIPQVLAAITANATRIKAFACQDARQAKEQAVLFFCGLASCRWPD